MKEIFSASERAIERIPQRLRDYVTVKVATWWLQAGKDYLLPGPRARRWGARMLEMWWKGEETPFSEFATKILNQEDFRVEGAENIPQGGAIVVVNETNEGPIRGNWVRFVFNFAAAGAHNFSGNYEARWVQEELSDKAIWNSPLALQRKRLSQMLSKSCRTVLIGKDWTNGQKRGAIAEMAKHLGDDGVLVISPECKDSPVLARARADAGRLVILLARRLDVPIVPVAAWWSGKPNIKIGRPLKINDVLNNQLLDLEQNVGQRTGDLLLVEIARLLPKGKRGVYRLLAKSRGF